MQREVECALEGSSRRLKAPKETPYGEIAQRRFEVFRGPEVL